MTRHSSRLISEVAYPKVHLSNLKRLGPLMIASMERDGLPVESGRIDLGKLDPELDAAYFLFMWMAETNKVIERLNLVLLDLSNLSKNISVLGGSPWRRYELLVRTFFHEFYRFRDVLNTMLGGVSKRGLISKEELTIARNAFHSAIEDTIEMRNSLVHNDVIWRGEAHFELHLVSTAHERGQVLVDKSSGNVVGVEGPLSVACDRACRVLQREGRKAALLSRAFIRDTAAAMR